ncbi:MAG: hypothetical protein K1X66_02630 [Verrucomicrobiae bacterium]|nr:hypothetical protein [Verrucomicrobiae bacterium]
MGEPTVSNPELTPEQQKTREAFLEIIKEIDNGVKKVMDHPLVKGLTSPASTEGCRTSVELQSHQVALGYEHTSVRVTPKDEKYKDDPRFSQLDEDGKRYATIGAGPVYNTLVSELNRPKDVGPHPGRIPMGPKDCKKEAEVIDTVLAKDGNYQDDLDYDLFPASTKADQAWYWADDSFNSNSYVSGLIDATGLPKPIINRETHPGWDKPLPAENFKDRTAKPILSTLKEAIADKVPKEPASRSERNEQMWRDLEQGPNQSNYSEEPNQSLMPPEEVNQSLPQSPGLSI